MTRGHIGVGGDHQGDLTLDCDVVVIGSGAGGAVVACELAEAGQRVVVLEEGPYVPLEEYRHMRPSEHMRRVWRDGAMTVAAGVGDTPTINVTMGRCVGGSSMLTGGVCFRTPDYVLNGWARALGLATMTPAALEPCFEAVEEAIHVESVPVQMRSRSTVLFGEGARRRGVELSPLQRNTDGCRGHARCNFGCPEGAKRSVDVTYLPRAVAAGAQIWSDCLVERVVIEGGRVVGVTGQLLPSQGWLRKGRRLLVHARRVVVAAGSYHTPPLLKRSGLRHSTLGRKMTLHPGFRMFARFDGPVEGYKGALQSAYTDAYRDEDITLVSLFVPPGVLVATMPGFGPELMERAGHVRHLAVFGGMIHDQGGGTVRPGPGREPIVTYHMAKRDRATVPKLVRYLGEAFLAAGAREVFPPILGQRGVDADGFRRLDLDHIPALRLECSSQHPLGSCRMGSSREASVVDPQGQSWDVEGLYVADGSVVPTSLGVNPQETIMAIATSIAWGLRDQKRN